MLFPECVVYGLRWMIFVWFVVRGEEAVFYLSSLFKDRILKAKEE